jgi:hypothetical protein
VDTACQLWQIDLGSNSPICHMKAASHFTLCLAIECGEAEVHSGHHLIGLQQGERVLETQMTLGPRLGTRLLH